MRNTSPKIATAVSPLPIFATCHPLTLFTLQRQPAFSPSSPPSNPTKEFSNCEQIGKKKREKKNEEKEIDFLT
jgi:hypothetical protein